jgi:hypothetical protein
MSLSMRIIFFSLIGIIAGVLAWPFAETVVFFQAQFPSILLFSIVLGVVIGILMGGCVGTSEGIMTHSWRKVRSGILAGILIGAIGGLVGFVIGQAALLLIGTKFFNSTSSFQNIGFPLSKAIGWAAFGMFVGMGEGIRSRSGDKVKHGIIGGLIGGFIGGFLFEYLRIRIADHYLGRLAGLAVLGLLIGLFYGIIENKLSRAKLIILNGKNRGKEFPLAQRVMQIGSSKNAEIGIEGYRGIADIHAKIKREKKSFTVVDGGSRYDTYVNDKKISQTKLQPDSVIRIGNAQLLFTV